jgi:hypothetical protein
MGLQIGLASPSQLRRGRKKEGKRKGGISWEERPNFLSCGFSDNPYKGEQTMDKEKLIEMTKNEMQTWHAKLDELKVQAKLGKSELHEILQPEINKIEQELGKVEERVKQLQGASEGALDDIKHGAEIALKAIRQSYEKASSHFKK